METQGQYKLKYTLNKVLTELVVKVELKKISGLMKPRENVWCGHATVDDKPYDDRDLPYCVNAKHMSEHIGIKIKEERKTKAKADGKSFRIKNEEIK